MRLFGGQHYRALCPTFTRTCSHPQPHLPTSLISLAASLAQIPPQFILPAISRAPPPPLHYLCLLSRPLPLPPLYHPATYSRQCCHLCTTFRPALAIILTPTWYARRGCLLLGEGARACPRFGEIYKKRVFPLSVARRPHKKIDLAGFGFRSGFSPGPSRWVH